MRYIDYDALTNPVSAVLYITQTVTTIGTAPPVVYPQSSDTRILLTPMPDYSLITTNKKEKDTPRKIRRRFYLDEE